jgi:branched-subunit amino acid transport protein
VTLWLTLFGMGLVTFAIRLVPILALDRLAIPPRLRQALRFVPPAVLSAILFPELLIANNGLDVSPGNERLLAGLLAIGVAWFYKNVLLTIAAGMAAVWVLQGMGL